MTIAAHLVSEDVSTGARFRWWLVLAVVSVVITVADIVTGPYIHFPILFVIPVGLGSWHLGRRTGVFFAVALVGCRFWIALTVDQVAAPGWAASVNAVIRLAVLLGLAVLLEAAHEGRALRRQIGVLEGILPICMFCKKIRTADGAWEQIERYVSTRSDAEFTHTFCDPCGREHYGWPPNAGAAGADRSASASAARRGRAD